ncbi:hypothetical protein HZH66_001400 [Vespula vulgaris]|uniref:Uncharacterized protein n=1 Tax=Vespula vulgaris TaxID=7454 RepID=A0A834NLK7_VESVU|nr:hypothetical protein HZH66_001400 [Vespula vulgaris]
MGNAYPGISFMVLSNGHLERTSSNEQAPPQRASNEKIIEKEVAARVSRKVFSTEERSSKVPPGSTSPQDTSQAAGQDTGGTGGVVLVLPDRISPNLSSLVRPTGLGSLTLAEHPLFPPGVVGGVGGRQRPCEWTRARIENPVKACYYREAGTCGKMTGKRECESTRKKTRKHERIEKTEKRSVDRAS